MSGMKIGVGSFLLAFLVSSAWSHGIGEPELEATDVFKDCCDAYDCRSFPMILLEKTGDWGLVRFVQEGVAMDVRVPSSSSRDPGARAGVVYQFRERPGI